MDIYCMQYTHNLSCKATKIISNDFYAIYRSSEKMQKKKAIAKHKNGTKRPIDHYITKKSKSVNAKRNIFKKLSKSNQEVNRNGNKMLPGLSVQSIKCPIIQSKTNSTATLAGQNLIKPLPFNQIPFQRMDGQKVTKSQQK
jgi:hypothetical protein